MCEIYKFENKSEVILQHLTDASTLSQSIPSSPVLRVPLQKSNI